MTLQKREKLLLKVLGFVAIFGALILYLVMKPQKLQPISGKADSYEGTSVRATGSSSSRSSRSTSSRAGGRSTAGITPRSFESHNTANDCWVIIDGAIYDITGYVQNYGAGTDITSYCGSYGFEAGFLGSSPSLKDEVIMNANILGSIG